MTPEAFEEALKQGYLFETKIARQGIVLYERLESPKEESPLKGRPLEWLGLGDADLEAARRTRAQPEPAGHLASFLGQPAAENYLKAFLEEQGLEPPNTHRPGVLLDLAGQRPKELLPLREDLGGWPNLPSVPGTPGFQPTPGRPATPCGLPNWSGSGEKSPGP